MSERYFDLNTNFARIVKDEQVELTVPSAAFIDAYFGHDLGVFPPAIRWISDVAPPSFIFERPPETRVINYRKIPYQICLPWTIYGISFASPGKIQMQVFCRPFSIQSFDDELFVLPVPEANEAGLVEGFTYPIQLSERRQIGPSIMQIIEKMYSTRTAKNFNRDVLPPTWSDIDTSTNVTIMEHWQKYSPSQAISDIEYHTSKEIPTVGELAKHLQAGADGETTFKYLETLVKEVSEAQG